VPGGETERALARQRGHVADLTRPLANGFVLSRTAVATVLNSLSSSKPVVALTGPPLVGKTNVLARVCDLGTKKRFVFLYVDMRRCRQGDFLALSHQFLRGISVPISVGDLRRWLARPSLEREDKPGVLRELVPGACADSLVVDGNPLHDLRVLQDQGAYLPLITKGGKIYKDTLGMNAHTDAGDQ
jgi:hypothetical protein